MASILYMKHKILLCTIGVKKTIDAFFLGLDSDRPKGRGAVASICDDAISQKEAADRNCQEDPFYPMRRKRLRPQRLSYDRQLL